MLGAQLTRRAVPLDQHVKQVVGSQTDLVASHAEDARGAGAKHLNGRAAAEPELLQPMHVVDRPEDSAHFGTLAGLQTVQRDDRVDHGDPDKSAGHRKRN